MSAKLILRVEWNQTVRTSRDPFDTKKLSNLSPEILVERIAPSVQARETYNSYQARENMWACQPWKHVTDGKPRKGYFLLINQKSYV